MREISPKSTLIWHKVNFIHKTAHLAYWILCWIRASVFVVPSHLNYSYLLLTVPHISLWDTRPFNVFKVKPQKGGGKRSSWYIIVKFVSLTYCNSPTHTCILQNLCKYLRWHDNVVSQLPLIMLIRVCTECCEFSHAF